MKKIFTFLIVAFCICVAQKTNAQTSGSCGTNLTWTLTGSGTDKTLTITGTGTMDNYSNSSAIPWYSERQNIKYLSIGNSVISIGDYAFNYCSGLTGALTIPNSVTFIGNQAFSGCSGLTSLTIPNSVTFIGDGAFRACSGLTSLTIPNSVIAIGNNAFRACSGLTGALTIPNSVTSIRNSAFSGCSGLTSLTIPNSVTSISYSAFKNCSGLKSVNFNATNCTTMGEGYSYLVFEGCTSLSSLTIGDNVQTIPAYAFSYCSGLTGALTIPNSVTFIGNQAFSGCSGLTSLTISDSVTSIGDYAFSACSGLTGALTIPNSVTFIGNQAFSGCSGLTSLTIPNSVTSISAGAFENCSGFTGALTIPNSVTSISAGAFFGCSGLTSLTIPNSVTSISYSAFQNCSGLTEITVKNSVPPACESNAFRFVNTSSCILYVPNGCITSYRKAPAWQTFVQIKEYSRISQAIEFPEFSTATYGDANTNIILPQYSDAGLPIAYVSNNTAVASVSGNTLSFHNAGIAQITASQNGNDDCFAATPVIRVLIVDKASLSITAQNVIRKQGEPNPVFELAYSGFKNNDNETILDELPSILCAADENSIVGIYDIILVGGHDNNYDYTLVDGTLEVISASGVNLISSEAVTLYPNPVQTDLFIKADFPIVKVEIYSPSGSLIKIEEQPSGKISMSGLSEGVYFVKIHADKGFLTHKVIKTP